MLPSSSSSPSPSPSPSPSSPNPNSSPLSTTPPPPLPITSTITPTPTPAPTSAPASPSIIPPPPPPPPAPLSLTPFSSSLSTSTSNHNTKKLSPYLGPFESYARAALRHVRWMLVLITSQSQSSLPTYTTNNTSIYIDDLPSDKLMIWRRIPTSSDVDKYTAFYPVDHFPHFALLDPRTRERLIVWNIDPTEKQDSWIDECRQFLQQHSLNHNDDGDGDGNGNGNGNGNGYGDVSSLGPIFCQEKSFTVRTRRVDRNGNRLLHSNQNQERTDLQPTSIMDDEEAAIAAAIAASLQQVEVASSSDDYEIEDDDNNDDDDDIDDDDNDNDNDNDNIKDDNNNDGDDDEVGKQTEEDDGDTMNNEYQQQQNNMTDEHQQEHQQDTDMSPLLDIDNEDSDTSMESGTPAIIIPSPLSTSTSRPQAQSSSSSSSFSNRNLTSMSTSTSDRATAFASSVESLQSSYLERMDSCLRSSTNPTLVEARRLRREQDLELEAALESDRAREAEEHEANMKRKQLELLIEQSNERVNEWEVKDKLSKHNCIHIMLRLPNGKRIIKALKPNTPLFVLRDLVCIETQGERLYEDQSKQFEQVFKLMSSKNHQEEDCITWEMELERVVDGKNAMFFVQV